VSLKQVFRQEYVATIASSLPHVANCAHVDQGVECGELSGQRPSGMQRAALGRCFKGLVGRQWDCAAGGGAEAGAEAELEGAEAQSEAR
jgi:hypothetical protein